MYGVRAKEVLAFNYKDGEKVKVSPLGEVIGYDGRKFSINTTQILKNLSSHELDIPLDENHSFAQAVGWFAYKSFELREDGIYAALELNKQGKALVDEKAYRYLSPVYEQNNKHEVIGIDSVGLVNRPNLLNIALNEKGDSVDKDKEIEELKAKLDFTSKALEETQAKLEENKKQEDAADKSQEQNKEENAKENEAITALKEQVEALNSKVDETNKKLSMFSKMDLEPNNQTGLSDEEKHVASLLGLSEDEYKGGR